MPSRQPSRRPGPRPPRPSRIPRRPPPREGLVRLQKVLAEAGVASRRACEELILAGEVEVDGEVVRELPCFVDPRTARIEVSGQRLAAPAAPRTVMIFKPRGVVSTNRDPHGRRRAIDLVPHAPGERLYPVGRLDVDSSGLLLLTNDGALANRLAHPRYGVHKGYEVLVSGRIDDAVLERLQKGVFLADRRKGRAARASASEIRVLRREGARTILYLELSEGRNRQVRRMLERFGHDVKRLRRVAMGPLQLGDLRPGEWRALTDREHAALESAAFGGAVATPAAAPRAASFARDRRSAASRRGPLPEGGSPANNVVHPRAAARKRRRDDRDVRSPRGRRDPRGR